MLVKFVRFMRVIGLRKLLTCGRIQLVNQEFISKNRDGFPSSETIGPIEEIKGCKNGTGILYLPAKFGGDCHCTAVWERKVGSFCFVTFWILNRGLVIEIDILSPFVSQYWCRFHHSLEEEMLFQMFKRHLNYATRWQRICLSIRLKFDFFSDNLKDEFVHMTSTI